LKATPTELPDVILLEPAVFRDERGWFMETFNAATMARLGLPTEFVQDNHSRSSYGVVRGLHYQLAQPQGKLLRCTRGRILDVAVDIRRSSPLFGKWMSVELSEENFRMLWIPPGFAHGFAVLSESAEVVYKCTTLWNKESDRTLLWNDPELGIEWGLTDPIISEKDQKGARLREAEVFD
jgi:dTDP-4-dehydrorhamnose 3,5-epimerase